MMCPVSAHLLKDNSSHVGAMSEVWQLILRYVQEYLEKITGMNLLYMFVRWTWEMWTVLFTHSLSYPHSLHFQLVMQGRHFLVKIRKQGQTTSSLEGHLEEQEWNAVQRRKLWGKHTEASFCHYCIFLFAPVSKKSSHRPYFG